MCSEEGGGWTHNTAGLWDRQEALSTELHPNPALSASSFIEDSC